MKYHDSPTYALARGLLINPHKLIRILNSNSKFKIISEILKNKLDQQGFSIASIWHTDFPTSNFDYWINRQKFFLIEKQNENVFAKSGKCAYLYARIVLRTRFDNEEIMFLNDGDAVWLNHYHCYFFDNKCKLPEIQHNYMIAKSLGKNKDQTWAAKCYLKKISDIDY